MYYWILWANIERNLGTSPKRTAFSSLEQRERKVHTFPVRDTSPVMATFCLTGLSVAKDRSAVMIVQPADGPSLGVAPCNQQVKSPRCYPFYSVTIIVGWLFYALGLWWNTGWKYLTKNIFSLTPLPETEVTELGLTHYHSCSTKQSEQSSTTKAKYVR